ncbi:protein rogdi-like [Saccostrea echinata]|uniref:protein rogdi-like n=1 Tax=Saccostrea echinata TaxID=191078 RepID=UPI002A809C38|nr:protein rogdi-like [Saccostrea echinata]
MDVTKEDDPEIETLRQELDWLLTDQVHKVLEEISSILWECSRRLPTRPGHDESKSLVMPQRLLLSCTNGSNGSVKCVVTLKGDRISDGDISFKHKQGKDNHVYKTSINPEVTWKLQQVQDATNFLYSAINIIEEQDDRTGYTSAKQVILLLDRVIDSLNQGRSALAFPKRKSLEELVYNRNMQTLRPSVPNHVALSFYVHASKLILSVYHLGNNALTHQLDIISRNQVECSVQWLNEAVMLFTLALQRCQQLKDKVCLLQQCDNGS